MFQIDKTFSTHGHFIYLSIYFQSIITYNFGSLIVRCEKFDHKSKQYPVSIMAMTIIVLRVMTVILRLKVGRVAWP